MCKVYNEVTIDPSSIPSTKVKFPYRHNFEALASNANLDVVVDVNDSNSPGEGYNDTNTAQDSGGEPRFMLDKVTGKIVDTKRLRRFCGACYPLDTLNVCDAVDTPNC